MLLSASNIQHGFRIAIDMWYISFHIFTGDIFLSSFEMMLEPIVQGSANEVYNFPSSQIDKPLACKDAEQNVPAKQSTSTQTLSFPRYLDKIQAFLN
jgi:hypothetical protein